MNFIYHKKNIKNNKFLYKKRLIFIHQLYGYPFLTKLTIINFSIEDNRANSSYTNDEFVRYTNIYYGICGNNLFTSDNRLNYNSVIQINNTTYSIAVGLKNDVNNTNYYIANDNIFDILSTKESNEPILIPNVNFYTRKEEIDSNISYLNTIRIKDIMDENTLIYKHYILSENRDLYLKDENTLAMLILEDKYDIFILLSYMFNVFMKYNLFILELHYDFETYYHKYTNLVFNTNTFLDFEDIDEIKKEFKNEISEVFEFFKKYTFDNNIKRVYINLNISYFCIIAINNDNKKIIIGMDNSIINNLSNYVDIV